MKRTFQFLIVALLVTPLLFGGSLAFAKAGEKGHKGTAPHGWTQGKKTGWHGGDQPPGLAKKAKENKEKKKKKEKKEKHAHENEQD